ncbi:MAG: hypothetical protein ABSF28_20330 [Terracidiphilus sp.]|jgi:hypothetical protein
MPQGVRIVFHGSNATPVPALQKAKSQLIALPGCRSTDQYGRHRPNQRSGNGTVADGKQYVERTSSSILCASIQVIGMKALSRWRQTSAIFDPCKPNDERFWDGSNWHSLCHVCHSCKTATDDGSVGHWR